MGLRSEKNELFKNSQVIILIFYSIFVGMHTVITFMFEWETWLLIPIFAGVITAWGLYIGNVFGAKQRIWITAGFMMVTYFIYGVHLTSTYDLAIVMASLMILFITAGIKGTIILSLITYYVTMTYDVINLVLQGEVFDSLLIARTTMHYLVMAMIAWFSVNTINKWKQIMDSSKEEIEELQDSTDRLNDFLANVSHEIRTPVNAIIGLSGICIEKEQDPDVEKDLKEVRTAGRKVADQIGDILDFSEVDRAKAVKNSEDYMVSSMMNDLMTDLRQMMKEEVELVIDVDPHIPAVMNSDVTKLKKIIKSLVSNGMKYTNAGGVYLRMYTEQQAYGVNLVIEVSDTGIGMNEAELERIRERFYQSDSGRARTSGGLGLGLAIVSGFVELLGGFMTINSKEDQGTKVRVSLPMTVVDEVACMSIQGGKKTVIGSYMHFENLANPMVREYYNRQAINMSEGLRMEVVRVENRDHLQKIYDEQRLTHLFVGMNEYEADKDLLEKMTDKISIVLLGGEDDKLPYGSHLRKMEKPFYAFPVVSIINSKEGSLRNTGKMMKLFGVRALVVDDEPMNIVVAKSIFKRYEMSVDSAASGQEAIECCREKGYDVIFMDHMMGGMDGVEAMKKIRSDAKGVNHETPMIALTANAMSSAKQMFLSEGFDGFVSKPIETEELERVLRKVMPKNQVFFVDIEEAEKNESGETPAVEEKPADEVKEEAAVTAVPAVETEKESDRIKRELKEAGVSVDEAMGYLNHDDELYVTLLTQFVQSMPEKLGNLNRYLEEKKIRDYEVLIHATKSNSRMIGFADLSEEAKALESAAREHDEEYIAAHHETACRKWMEAGRIISDVLKIQSEVKPKEEEVMEFSPDEPLEFNPEASDDVFEFAPAEGGDQA